MRLPPSPMPSPYTTLFRSKIGVVDLQRALVETEDGRKAKDQLKKLFEQRQKTLDKQQDELKAMKESVEKQRDVLAREVWARSEEHTSELQSPCNIVCRLLP